MLYKLFSNFSFSFKFFIPKKYRDIKSKVSWVKPTISSFTCSISLKLNAIFINSLAVFCRYSLSQVMYCNSIPHRTDNRVSVWSKQQIASSIHCPQQIGKLKSKRQRFKLFIKCREKTRSPRQSNSYLKQLFISIGRSQFGWQYGEAQTMCYSWARRCYQQPA